MPESDEQKFQALQLKQLEEWESLCGRCGNCCGLGEGDPCEHLRCDASGKYLCSIYEHRFGLRKSISGREFMCVPIRNILHQSWAGDSCCGYKKYYHQKRMES
jgi:uncharacterized cysteine cluster protein YcgN (CxxCxxCC family)